MRKSRTEAERIKRNARARQRRAEEPGYREKLNTAERERRNKDIEKTRKLARAFREADPQRMRNYALKYRHKFLPKPTRLRPALCECCGGPPGIRALHLDHCHVNNTFRGWLCGKCNTSIGKLGDNLLGVLNAVSYLLRKN